ncbi:MAG: hypothetical protein ACI8XO_001564 [Verrucomicrobiales bacterium]
MHALDVTTVIELASFGGFQVELFAVADPIDDVENLEARLGILFQ